MDCHLSRLMLAFRRSDLTAEDALSLDSHLAGCPTCSAVARRDGSTDKVFAAAMTAVPVPSGLHAKLMTGANARLSAARWRKATPWVGGVVAVVVAAFTVGGVGWLNKPTLDTQAVAVEFDQKLDFAATGIPTWLTEEGLPPTLLDGFDFRLPTFVGRGQLLGKEVPTVLFLNGPQVAQVAIVPVNRFRIDATKLNDAQSSRGNVKVFRRDGVYLVVTFTTDSLNPFLMPPAAAG